ncbi:alpha-amylase family glycosyl hydrolase [Anaerobranca gottschalkii]|uniref:Glycosidase n=2 Tax=Anaerobranca gottschalkii TaxID=108328 RepID=A0A1H9ZT18_9FIRM|nr:alpha-amylase family glycosyl hydrolase [Anaerobranca gottschalkii]CAH61550.1 cyclodextrin glycosyltransferase [Anaerobranca gottschalkii]SES83962.1 Glycosidase [Anaerobranca gottschalkii DSM 13577]
MINKKNSIGKAICICLSILLLFGVLSIFQPVTNATQNSLEHIKEHTSVNNQVNYATDVIYQIVTDRFLDGDKYNNPTCENLYSEDGADLRKYLGGDWRGIIQKIEDGYLPDMGISAIWISSPVENIYAVHPQFGTSYHGYWARDFKRNNPFFGDLNDFRELIAVANEHDIKVIIDFAPNHTSPAEVNNPNYAEDGNLYNNGEFVASYSNDLNEIFYHFGGTDFSTYEDSIYRNLFDLAGLNLNNNFVDQYLRDSIKFWLDLGVDGIRVDAVKHMPLGWQKSFVDTIYNHKPVFVFGEWYLGKDEYDPNYYHFANNSGMSLLDFEFAQTTRSVFRNHEKNMFDLYDMLKNTENNYERVVDQVTFIDNHDMDRFHYDGATKRNVEIGLAFLLTSRGVPTIYYGTEQYLTGNGDPYNRKPMSSFDQNTKAYKIIQKLAPLRKSNPALAYGTTQERWLNNDVIIYERKFGNNIVLVAINRNLSQSYSITGLNTKLPEGYYYDELDGLLSGKSITVNPDGSVNQFIINPGEVSIWQFAGETITPLIGQVGPIMGQVGNKVTISGVGFGDKKGTVNFGEIDATIISWTNSVIQIEIPSVPAGNYEITVSSEGGEKSNSYNFEVLTNKQIPVRFVVNNAYTSWGQNVYLVGNVHELGNWDPNRAIGPFFNQVVYQYPTWYLDISVPADTTLEFKFIKIDESGNVIWQSGLNRVYTTPEKGTDTIYFEW